MAERALFSQKSWLSAFAHRDYRLLFAGTAATQTGNWMQQVALGWLVLDLTGSGLYLGLAGFLRSIPQLFFSIPGGILADRTDRARLLAVTQGLSALLSLVLALLIWSGRIEIWQVLLLTFLIGSAMALLFPVRQALVSTAVPRADLANAVGLNSANNNLNRTLGPALAGILVTSVGVAACFFLQAAGLFFAFWTSLAMRVPPQERVARPGSPLVDLAEAWAYVRGTPEVAGLLLSALVPTALGMPYMALLPMFARDLGIGAGGLGILMTVLGVGSIAGSIAFSAAGDFRGKGRVMLLSAGAFGLALLGLAGSVTLPLTLASLFGTGFASAIYQAANNTLLQSIVPDALRGRVLSAYILTWGVMPLGTLPLGWLADQAGAPTAVGLAGALVVLFSAAVALRLPAVRAL
ncbi:MAG TPA: MFS transporter [Chloroflexota bacterium]